MSELEALRDAAADAFGSLIYIFETSDDEQTSKAAKEAADKLDHALANAAPTEPVVYRMNAEEHGIMQDALKDSVTVRQTLSRDAAPDRVVTYERGYGPGDGDSYILPAPPTEEPSR